MVAGGDVRLDAACLLQGLREEGGRDGARIDSGAVDLDRRVGDDIGRVERIVVGFGAVAGVDIVDQALVQRPGVHAAFPVIDDGVAEAVGLGLLIGDARRLPGLAGRSQRFRRGRCEQRVDRSVESARRGQRILVLRQRDVGIGREHRLRVRFGVDGARPEGHADRQGRGCCADLTARLRHGVVPLVSAVPRSGHRHEGLRRQPARGCRALIKTPRATPVNRSEAKSPFKSMF